MTRHKLKTTIPHGDPDLGAEVDVEITFDYRAGRPMVHTLRNGDPGYPADPPEVEFVSVTQLVGDNPITLGKLEQNWLDELVQGYLEGDGWDEALKIVTEYHERAWEEAAELRRD